MEGATYVDLFATKGIEYLLVIGFLAALVIFWRFLNGTAGRPVPSIAAARPSGPRASWFVVNSSVSPSPPTRALAWRMLVAATPAKRTAASSLFATNANRWLKFMTRQRPVCLPVRPRHWVFTSKARILRSAGSATAVKKKNR